MVKKFKQYIDEENLKDTPVITIAKKQGIPLDQITKLYCNNNKLTSLEGIENLVNLETLHCYNNQITSLEGIENLINLEKLYCSNNQLTSLEGIENLIKLEHLACPYNSLTSLKGIENIVNLKELYCFGNKFSDDHKEYFLFEIKLDRLIKNNDFSEFSKIYNAGKKEWRNEYYKKRPDIEDVIDGINVGLFSLKTESRHIKSLNKIIY